MAFIMARCNYFAWYQLKKFSAYIVSQIRQSVSESYSVSEVIMFLSFKIAWKLWSLRGLSRFSPLNN